MRSRAKRAYFNWHTESRDGHHRKTSNRQPSTQHASHVDQPQALDNVVLENLPLGAHLTTPRLGYMHHGIYTGAGRVIHYAGFTALFRRGPIEEVSLDQFARGRGFSVRTEVGPKFSGAATVERARSRLGENRYRFWSNNCEHFSEWCASGISRSLQVQAFETFLKKGVSANRSAI
jgi:Lecithin retinol acyltransferase